MAFEGIIWTAVMFGSAGVRDPFGRRYRQPARLARVLGGLVTQAVLWVGLATSMIYVVSGFAQYAMGRTIIDRYPLKSTYIVASALQIRHDRAWPWATAISPGAIASAVLEPATGPIENILIARLRPAAITGWASARSSSSRSARPDRHPADRLGAQTTASSTCCSMAWLESPC